MAATTGGKAAPGHPVAVAALAMAIVSLALSFYGSFLGEKHMAFSPLNEARNEPGLEVTRNSKIARYSLQAVAYFVPFALGIAAAMTGAVAMRRIELGNGKYSGNTRAVFAVLVGGLATVTSGCMILSLYVWKHLPPLYTT
jgi:phosphate/sulfate permease